MAATVLLGSQNAPPASGQQPQVFRAGVDVIRLDVNVVDKDNQPIAGLTADDFQVFEDGKAQRIVAVSEIDAVAADPAPSPWMRTATRDVATNDLVDLAGTGRVFAILLDDFNTPWDDQGIIMSAREIAREVIDGLAPSDLAAVVFPLEAGRTQDFTTDRRKLLEAVSLFNPREPDMFILNPNSNTYRGPGPGGGDMPQRFAPSMARSNCENSQPVVPTLDTVVRQLATVPNRRKTIVFISTGVPLRLGARGNCPERLSDMMRDVYRTAQRSNVNIHSFDPGGYRGYEDYLQRPVRSNGRANEFVHTPESARNAARLRHDFMEITSDETGAVSVVNSQELVDGIAKMFAQDARYYIIGYETSNGRPDGKFRRIEVKVGRPGVSVRARSGYYAPREGTFETAEQKRAPASNELGLTGLTSSAALPLRANAVAIAPAADGKGVDVAVVLTTRLPAVRTAMAESINVVRHVYDARSKPGPPVQEKTDLMLQPSGGDETRYDIFQRITLPPGRHQVRLNGTSTALGRSGSVYVDVDVPDFSQTAFAMTRIALGPRAAEPRTDPFAALLPVVPTTARDFTANDPLVAFVRLFQNGEEKLPVSVSAQIVDVHDVKVYETSSPLAPDRFDGPAGVGVEFALPLDRLSRGPHILNIGATRGSMSLRHDLVFRIR
jgi:VWFA-related protein